VFYRYFGQPGKGKMHLGKEIMHAAQQKDRYFVTLSHLLTRTY